jgi:error-prone DNA polymerase
MPRHLSQHVGGFILTERPLTETVPIGNGAMDDRTFIEWDKDDIEELGILKIDVLALGMLTCIRKCFDLIDEHHGERWELATSRRRCRRSTTCCAKAIRWACSRSRAGRR